MRNRGCTRPSAAGYAPWRAIESVVRDAGRIVVWVEASAEVMIASTTIQSEPLPSTSVAIAPKRPASSSYSAISSSPAKATTAVVVAT